MTKLGTQAQDLYDLLALVVPNGRSRNGLMKDLGIMADPINGPTTKEIIEFHKIKGYLQDLLGMSDIVTMVGKATPGDQGWIYSLQGDPTHPVSKEYMMNKAITEFAREKRGYMVMKALSAGIAGNTVEGRYIRKAQRSAYRRLEDTQDFMVDLGMAAPALPPRPPGRYP